MKITFTGTGTSSGVPMIGCTCAVCVSTDPRDNRLRTSSLIETGGRTISIDAGPDFRMQMLRAGVKQLDGILLTHRHKDHIAGLDDIRAFNFFSKKAIPIWASSETIKALHREYAYAFETPPYPGVPRMNLITIENEPFHAWDVPVLPVLLLHAQMEVFGFRIGKFVYLTDAQKIPEPEWPKLYDAEVLVVNALRHEPHPSHFTLSEAIETGRRSGAKLVYFTHISHQLGRHAEVEKMLPQNMHLAFDGLTLNL